MREKDAAHGNTLAFRSFVLLKVGRRHHRPCGLEQPFLSKMAWLSFWKTLLDLGFDEHFIASCAFGSIHKKMFRFLLYLIQDLTVRCPGGHSHVRIEGKWTKGSATYVDGLALHVARGFQKALRHLRSERADERDVAGIESVVANEVLCATPWKVEKVWEWKKKSHINVLESFSSVAALGIASERKPDSRICLGVDSKVSKGALARGRSSARSLQPLTKRACAIQLAFGTYPIWFFSPTRLNPTDAPTRDRELDFPTRSWILDFLDLESLADLHFVGLRRYSANWVRLFLLVQLVGTVSAESFIPKYAGTCGFYLLATFLCIWACALGFWILSLRLSSLSVSSFRLPGLILVVGSLSSVAFSSSLSLAGLWVIVFASRPCVVSAMEPLGAAEKLRAAQRRNTLLPADRVVRKETRKRRLQLLNQFRTWLWQNRGISLHSLMTESC